MAGERIEAGHMVQSMVLSQLTGALLSSQNPDGGWGYYSGKASRIEPTCWAILTLLQVARSSIAWDSDASFRLLERWQRNRGLLAEQVGQPSNLAFNGLAVLAVLHGKSGVAVRDARLARIRDALLRGILSVAGVRFLNARNRRLYETLQGWPWIEQTFSWVEPTSMCLLALKKARPITNGASAVARMDEAEKLLFDRSCREGGWNFGTPEVLGVPLPSYVPTTALALLALQDHADHPVVVRGTEFLTRQATREISGMALGLAAIALRIHHRPVDDVESRLLQAASTTLSVGNLANVAMAALGLAGGEPGVEPFVL